MLASSQCLREQRVAAASWLVRSGAAQEDSPACAYTAALMAEIDWNDLAAVRNAIAHSPPRTLSRGFVLDNAAHHQVLLALTAAERRGLAANSRLVSIMTTLATRWAASGRISDARPV